MSEAAIRFRDVSKEYQLESLTRAGFKNFLLHLPSQLRRRWQGQPFRALDRVSFEVARGECFGVIGRNGSGKSTTLGLAAGVLRPTEGAVETKGTIAPLLELGAGFHPELSGRENIELNAVLLGLTRRAILDRMADVIAFAELGDFIERPMRVYSSGMVARLGFSVAMHLDPEILLIDEVLAVGDRSFQAKCLRKMDEFRARGVSIMFVSHNLADVERTCDRVALLEHGHVVTIAPPREAIQAYEDLLRAAPTP